MMKKILALLLALVMVFALAACGQNNSQQPAANNSTPAQNGTAEKPAGDSAPAQKYAFQLASVAPNGSALIAACTEFKTKVEARTNGNVTIEIFPGSTLGSGAEYMQQVIEGNIALATCANDTTATYWPEFNVFNAPFVWNDKSECDAICDGEIGAELWQVLEDAGVHVLSTTTTYNGSGFRLVTSNIPIYGPGDMKNLKIRVMENQILLAGWKTLGCNPTPVAFTEVFTSLQQGAIDAQENPMDLIYMMKFYEAQKYIIETNHLLQPAPIVMNKAIFESLPEEYQTILTEEANNAGLYQREIGPQFEAEYRQAAEAAGVTYIELTDAQRDEFRALLGPVYDMVVEASGPIAEKFFAALNITW